jgi:hypothetical protein
MSDRFACSQPRGSTMTDFSLRVGVDIFAQQVSATWGTAPDEHRPVVEVEQSPQGYQQLSTSFTRPAMTPLTVRWSWKRPAPIGSVWLIRSMTQGS